MTDTSTRIFGSDSIEMNAVAEVRLNSQMLYQDAKTLFEAERWGTSIALSILSCEEAGKFMMFVSSLGTPFHQIDRLLYHKEKQKEFAYRLRSCLRVRALDEYYLGLGETRESERLLKALRFYEDCAAIAAELDDAEETISAHPELGPVWREIHRRTSEDEAYIVAEQATLGQLDKVKQLGIYVDVGASAVMSPRQFSKKDAELYLKAAEIVTESIKLNDKTEYQVTCMTVTELP